MGKEATFGGILRELLSLLADTGRDVALFTLALGGLTAVGVAFGLTETSTGSLHFGFRMDVGDSPASALFEIVSGIASIVATYFLVTRFLGARGYRAAGNRFWPYLGAAILSGIATVLGLLLLIVPGVILLVRWSAVSGFAVGAGQGVSESLNASWNATRGHSWAIFFSAIVLFFGLIVCGGVVGGIAGLLGETVVDTVSAFVEAAASAVFAAFGIAIFSLVNSERQEISEVFA